jgi:hypothetical protein
MSVLLCCKEMKCFREYATFTIAPFESWSVHSKLSFDDSCWGCLA